MTDPDRLPTDRPATADGPVAGPTWLTLDEAAQALGTSREAVRSRARRGSLHSMKGNDGVLRVLVDRQADRLAAHGRPPGRPPVDQPDREVDRLAAQVAALRAEVARLQAERDGAHARLTDRDAELDRARADHAAELARLQQIMDRLTEPWWRRWFGG